jgi:hypothetical protein
MGPIADIRLGRKGTEAVPIGYGDMEHGLETLEGLGLSLPSASYLVGVVVFSFIGIFAYYAGKRRGRPRSRWLGLALMLYPYGVWQTWLLYLVGIGLSIAVWFDLR